MRSPLSTRYHTPPRRSQSFVVPSLLLGSHLGLWDNFTQADQPKPRRPACLPELSLASPFAQRRWIKSRSAKSTSPVRAACMIGDFPHPVAGPERERHHELHRPTSSTSSYLMICITSCSSRLGTLKLTETMHRSSCTPYGSANLRVFGSPHCRNNLPSTATIYLQPQPIYLQLRGRIGLTHCPLCWNRGEAFGSDPR